MKINEPLLRITELLNYFSQYRYIRKSELENFYRQKNQEFDRNTFRRILYGLTKKGVIFPLGAGLYSLQTSRSSEKKRIFAPNISSEIIKLNIAIQENFPYIDYMIWETRILYEFMLHLPGQNYFVIEVEEEVCESVFNKLSEIYQGRVFLVPDRLTMERYVFQKQEPILISRLISQSPKKKIKGIPYPKLEKVLIDLFSDKDKFLIFQGSELITIYKNAFRDYWINPKTLLRYAGRRNVIADLQNFLLKNSITELGDFFEGNK